MSETVAQWGNGRHIDISNRLDAAGFVGNTLVDPETGDVYQRMRKDGLVALVILLDLFRQDCDDSRGAEAPAMLAEALRDIVLVTVSVERMEG